MEKESKIYSPEFIPYYTQVVKDYKLNDTEALVYGFIRFYTNNSNFFFKDIQLAEILNRKSGTIANALTSLENKQLIERDTKIVGNNGSIRKIRLHFGMNHGFTFKGTTASLENEVKDNINNNNKITIVDKKSSIEKIYKKYKDGIDIESKHLYPSATKIYLEQLLSSYTEEQLLNSIDNYFAETDRKRRKSPKYFFSNSKRSDNYRIFEGFIKEETMTKKDLDINNLFF